MSTDKPTESVSFNGWMPADFHIVCSPHTDYGRRIRIGIWGRLEGGHCYAASEVSLEHIGQSGEDLDLIPDALELTISQAEELMDSLWEAGIRPSKSKLKKLQVGALESHLEDMRSLVFDHLLPVVKRPPFVFEQVGQQARGNIDITSPEDTDED